MFDDLLLHPKTKASLESFVLKPTHALTLVGQTGAGKLTLARYLAAAVLELSIDKLDSYPHFMHVQKKDAKQDISIEAVRQINNALRLQIPGSKSIRRVVVIENAQFMSTEAQNAFLKSLEAPPANTLFILTSTSKSSLLPTIMSRTQTISVYPLALKDIPDHQNPAVVSVWRLSRGAAGHMTSLLSDDDDDIKSAVNQAKLFIKKSQYERLVEIDSLNKDKQKLIQLLDGMARVIQALYRASAEKNNQSQVSALLAAMDSINEARAQLDANVVSRLAALRLAVNFNISLLV